MTEDVLERALRAFCRRQPFRPFRIEFNSSSAFVVFHPEAVERHGPLFVGRYPDGRYEVFAADDVSRLFDPPAATG